MRSSTIFLLFAVCLAVGTYAYPAADDVEADVANEEDPGPVIGKGMVAPNKKRQEKDKKKKDDDSSDSSEEVKNKKTKKEDSSSEEDEKKVEKSEDEPGKKEEDVVEVKSRMRRARISEEESDVSEDPEQTAKIDKEVEHMMRIIKPWKKFDHSASKHRKIQENQEPPAPTFLKEMDKTAVREFVSLKYDKEMTKEDKKEKLTQWATDNDVSEQFEEFMKLKKEYLEKQKAKRQEVLTKLVDIVSQADEILENDELSWNQVTEKLEPLMTTEDAMLGSALKVFYPFMVRDNGHRRHHGHHGRRPRNIGHGAQPRHEIGNGVQGHNRGHKGHNDNYNLGGGVRPNDRNYDPYHNSGKHHHGF